LGAYANAQQAALAAFLNEDNSRHVRISLLGKLCLTSPYSVFAHIPTSIAML
jgi:hypothetical protein